jgi:WD40 repeat protein
MDVSDGKYNSHRETLLEPESFTCFEEVKASMQKDKIFHSRSFLVRLRWMEETILRDIFHKQILCYRGLPEAETISLCEETSDPPKVSKHEPILDYLLTYSCSLCKGHKVTSVGWNQVNADILAVGYEVHISSDEDEEARGMVLIWSLCNPTFPHNKMYIESGVTCLAFSTQRPYILSVGTENGSIFLFDINSPNQNNLIHPIADSSNCCSMSKSAIWELKWICKIISDENNLNDNRRNYCEFLVSVGSDGRVIEWSTDIGLSVSCTLMTFKHNSPYPTCLRTTTGALCVDFPSSQKYSKADDCAFPSCNKGLAPLTYLVGAEDGKIYECCNANTKQPLDSFTGHEAPVYRIRYHPVNPKLFLTCSEDCTVKLWSENSGAGKEKDQGKFLEEKTFTPQDLWDAVNDVAWSFSSPNVFAIVTEDGRLQLYDISKSPGDPILTHYSNGAGRKAKEFMPQLEHNNNAVDSTFTENESIGQIPTKKDITRPPAFTCVAFHRLCPVLVVGDDIGNVFIFRYSSTALDGLK